MEENKTEIEVVINQSIVKTQKIRIPLPYFYCTWYGSDGCNAYNVTTWGMITRDKHVSIEHNDEYMDHAESFTVRIEEFIPENQADEKFLDPRRQVNKQKFCLALDKALRFTSKINEI